MAEQLIDSFGRVHDYLRISVTDKCNLRCFYCMPENPCFMNNNKLMTTEEIKKIAAIFVNQFGIKKIRLTGGEPLLRKGIDEILLSLSHLNAELGITTNGVLLKKNLQLLKEAKVTSLNVSLDSLISTNFKKITRRDHFQDVKPMIEQAVESGMRVKVNVVAMKGVNESEISDFVRWTKDLPLHVRFIEFMPFDGNHWNWDKVLPQEEILNGLNHQFEIQKLKDDPNSTARSYRVPGFKGTFALISSVTLPFCESCNRIRLTADGKLRNCLFATKEWDLLNLLREGKDLNETIREAVSSKSAARGGLPPFEKQDELMEMLSTRSMVKIGG